MILSKTILENPDAVAEQLNHYEETVSPAIFEAYIAVLRTQIANEVSFKFHENGKKGAIDAATGVGKSYFAIKECIDLVSKRPQAKILLVVPTEELRDNNWKDEFEKWGAIDIYNNNLKRVCYASLHKIRNEQFDFIIEDEYHHITTANAIFFKHNIYEGIMCLSATKPKSLEKLRLLEAIGIKTIVHIPLATAVKLKLVSPYSILVVETRLDNFNRNIEAGGKEKKFMVTEKQNYDYKDKKLQKMLYSKKDKEGRKKYEYAIRERMRLVYNMSSKKEIARYLLDNFIPESEKYLIFAGSIEHANELCKYKFHSKNKRYNAKHLQLFNDDITNRLACVEALNEGVNIRKVKGALALQVNSVDRDLVQRLGRLIRYVRGHKGKFIILCCIDTQDKEWTETALESFDESTITRTSYSQILVGNFKYNDF
jgi:superfamily II DNA or RNA helicase